MAQAVDGADVIIHFATAIPSQDAMRHRASWDANDRLRSIATGHLTSAAIHSSAERFIQQSVAFYADGVDRRLDESSPIEPAWDVMDSALAAEAHVDRFRRHGDTAAPA